MIYQLMSFKFLGRNKSGFIENILKHVNSVHHSDASLGLNLNILKDGGFDDPAPAHDFYKQWFNLVDIADKKWYAVADHHPNHLWKAKMLFATMRHFMTNVWNLVTSKNYTKWIDFQDNLAADLVSFWKS